MGEFSEVERLRGAVNEWETKWQQEAAQVGLLRAQVAERDALLRGLEGKTILSWPDKHRISAALSASAEPSSPKCVNCGASTGQACNDSGCGYLEGGNGEPSAPVEIDERAELRSHLDRMIGQAEYMLELAENSFDGEVDEDDGSFDECREYIEQARAALERKP